jgi:hypothetical protein
MPGIARQVFEVSEDSQVIAFLIAVATNLFAYWRSDKMVLPMALAPVWRNKLLRISVAT